MFFTWACFDEMVATSGSRSAELLDDGTLAIEFAYHLGDEAVLKSKRRNSLVVNLGPLQQMSGLNS